MGKRFIKLYEQITEWEWYKDINTFRLFVHLLLKANYCERDFHGVTVKRGQLVTSLPKLSTDVGLSIQQTRTALDHLKSTGEITDASTTQNRIITIVNYDRYQSSTDKSTEDQQTINRRSNRRSTDDLTPSIEYIEYKERVERVEKNKTPSVFKPPTIEEVTEYCRERGNRVDPEKWFDFYESKGWMIGKNKMKDWKAAVRTWEKDVTGKWPPKTATTQPAQTYEQRSYASEQDEAADRMMNSEWGNR